MTWPLRIAEEAVAEQGSMQKPAELAALLGIVRALDPLTIWEIGTATGGTLWALSRVPGRSRLFVSIDLPDGPYGGDQCVAEERLHELVRPHGLKVIRGDSRTVEIPKRYPQLLIIDGDHSQSGVYADWERYSPLVTPGGIIALHDILEHPTVSGVDVRLVWEEIVALEPHTVEIVDCRPAAHGGQWGGWGVVYR